jgi:hypothetical protein
LQNPAIFGARIQSLWQVSGWLTDAGRRAPMPPLSSPPSFSFRTGFSSRLSRRIPKANDVALEFPAQLLTIRQSKVKILRRVGFKTHGVLKPFFNMRRLSAHKISFMEVVHLKKLILAVLCLCVVGVLGFSQITQADLDKLDDAQRMAEDMLDSLLKVLPNAATQQNIQPKAWIGYLVQIPYPEITKKSGKVTKELPHFTIGPAFGVALMKTDKFNEVGKTLNGDDIIPIPFVPWPSISIDARIGGIKAPGINLPFDLGFSYFGLDFDLGTDMGLNWKNWGVDARYLILHQNGLIPDVSANVGFAHWSINLDTEAVDAKLATNTVYFGGQASYTLWNFFTPYLGLKMMTGRNKATMTLTLDDDRLSQVPFLDRSRTLGPDKTFFQAQIFGGFGLDWLMFQSAIGVSIDVTSGTLGVNFIPIRFSL